MPFGPSWLRAPPCTPPRATGQDQPYMAEAGPAAAVFPIRQIPLIPPESSQRQTVTWEESRSCEAPLRARGAPCAPPPTTP